MSLLCTVNPNYFSVNQTEKKSKWCIRCSAFFPENHIKNCDAERKYESEKIYSDIPPQYDIGYKKCPICCCNCTTIAHIEICLFNRK